MKKRILSIFLTLCMVLAVLPVTVFAADANFKVTTAAGAVTDYETFSAALAFAQENNGSTLKCLADVNDKDIEITKGNFTIDANGKTFTSAIRVGSGATVTIDGNGRFNRIIGQLHIYVDGTLNIKSGTFYTTYAGGVVSGIIQAAPGSTLNISGGDFNQVDAVANGTISGGTFRWLNVGGYTKLSGGKCKRLESKSGNNFDANLVNGYGIKYSGSWTDASTQSVGNVSDADYYVEIAKGSIQDFTLNSSEASNDNVRVEVQNIVFSSAEYEASKDQVRYQYKLDDGSWSASTAEHIHVFDVTDLVGNHTIYVKVTLDGFTLEKSVGFVIEVEIVEVKEKFKVTTAAGAVTDYETFSAALAFAQENNGSTLKCLADVNDQDIEITKGNFTIDANGKTFTSAIRVGSGATVTIDGNGRFNRIIGRSHINVDGTLNIKSGTFYTTYADGVVSGIIQATPGSTLNISGGDFNQVDAIANGTISGGTFRWLNVGGYTKLSGGKCKRLQSKSGNNFDAHLANGYGIKYNGSWTDALRQTIGSLSDDDYYVEIAESPIQDFTLQLTETDDGNLTVEVKDQVISDDFLETYPNARAELRYRYKVDNGDWTALTDSETYTFAPGSAGKHTISVITSLRFNNCEKSIDYYVIGYQSEDGEGSIPSGVKFDGEAYTLSEDTFTCEGFRQIGWQDEQGNIYDLGALYTENAGMIMSPVWEEIITVEVPFTTTVDLGDNTEPAEKSFELELLGSKAGGDWESNVTVEGSVMTDGEGNYSGKLKFTGIFEDIRCLLCESALVRQVNDGAENWTYDNAVYALMLIEDASLASDMISEPDNPTFHIAIYPTTEIEPGYYEFDCCGESLKEMSFKNIYTLHTHDYTQKFDVDKHWDECACGDVQNKEAHKYGEWKVTKEATTSAKGEKEHVCSICKYTETAEIPMLEKSEPPKTDAPQTGDNSNMPLWIVLLLASGSALIGVAAYSKKRKRSAK